jgi:hypothetical protein
MQVVQHDQVQAVPPLQSAGSSSHDRIKRSGGSKSVSVVWIMRPMREFDPDRAARLHD